MARIPPLSENETTGGFNCNNLYFKVRSATSKCSETPQMMECYYWDKDLLVANTIASSVRQNVLVLYPPSTHRQTTCTTTFQTQAKPKGNSTPHSDRYVRGLCSVNGVTLPGAVPEELLLALGIESIRQ
jgi:hypothetical protein